MVNTPALDAKGPNLISSYIEGVKNREAVESSNINQESALETLRARRAERDRQDKARSLAENIAGDDPMGKLMAYDPQMGNALARYQAERKQDSILKSAKLAAGVMNAPEDQRPQAYAKALEIANQFGVDTSKMPQQYTPEVNAVLDQYIAYGRDLEKTIDPNAGSGSTEFERVLGQAGFNQEQKQALMQTRAKRLATGVEDIGSSLDLTFGKEFTKADIKRVKTLKEDADKAEGTLQDISLFRRELADAGYTGAGGEALAKADVLLGDIFPGDAAAREAIRSKSTELQLSFTEKTKGAISDNEMNMFKAATPGLSTTPRGNQKILLGMETASKRIREKALFEEEWLRRNKSLDGSAMAWKRFTQDNPVITGNPEDPESWKIVPDNITGWQSYINGGNAQEAAQDRSDLKNMSDEDLMKELGL